jgi:hypothetical protein
VSELKELDAQLARHDWFYNFSDCHRTWKAGESSLASIKDLAKMSPEHGELYEAWSRRYFSGDHFNNKDLFTREQLDAVRKKLGVIT